VEQMMRRLILGIGGALLAIAVVVGVVFLSPQAGGKKPIVGPTQAAALDDPFGEQRDRKDVGEDHYIMGRYQEAIDYWIGAAAKGNAYAAHRLGVEYMDGKPGVVQRDYDKARQYHLQAARQGYSLSMFDLGSMNEYGYGVDKNLSEAGKWYRHSAEYGLAQGQYNFATMLEAGDGVPQDQIEALKFYILAARGGFAGVPFNSSANKIDQDQATPAASLASRLSKDQYAEARARADHFVAATGPLTAE
jgi:TPR repeat protein